MELQEKTLVVKRHDMVYEDVMANYVSLMMCYMCSIYILPFAGNVAEMCPD